MRSVNVDCTELVEYMSMRLQTNTRESDNPLGFAHCCQAACP